MLEISQHRLRIGVFHSSRTSITSNHSTAHSRSPITIKSKGSMFLFLISSITILLLISIPGCNLDGKPTSNSKNVEIQQQGTYWEVATAASTTTSSGGSHCPPWVVATAASTTTSCGGSHRPPNNNNSACCKTQQQGSYREVATAASTTTSSGGSHRPPWVVATAVSTTTSCGDSHHPPINNHSACCKLVRRPTNSSLTQTQHQGSLNYREVATAASTTTSSGGIHRPP